MDGWFVYLFVLFWFGVAFTSWQLQLISIYAAHLMQFSIISVFILLCALLFCEADSAIAVVHSPSLSADAKE